MVASNWPTANLNLDVGQRASALLKGNITPYAVQLPEALADPQNPETAALIKSDACLVFWKDSGLMYGLNCFEVSASELANAGHYPKTVAKNTGGQAILDADWHQLARQTPWNRAL
jgi:hypothetical protein